MSRPGIDTWTPRKRKQYLFNITHFDLVPACSPLEKKNFEDAFSCVPATILPYGGAAHMDRMLECAQVKQEPLLVWFPTYREKKDAAEKLNQMIQKIIQSPEIVHYLETEKMELAIVNHINSGKSIKQVPASSRIHFHEPGEILPLLSRASCFISDYSGLIIDWLSFNRPIIHFPFDEMEYLKTRHLCISLEDLQYGPFAHSFSDLIKILEQNTWKDKNAFIENRNHWMQVIFPDLSPIFSKRCYETIRDMWLRFDESSRTFQPSKDKSIF